MKADVLNPVATVSLGGDLGTIEVREMRWKDYLRVVKEMTSTAFELFAGGKIGVNELSLDKEKLLKAISGQEELVEWIVEKTTNVPKDKIAELTGTQLLKLLDVVIELNLRPELVEAGKALAGRMGAVFGVKNQSPKPSTALSSSATR